jgi:uncharacterized membrane protein YbhN (UPF0104 family)
VVVALYMLDLDSLSKTMRGGNPLLFLLAIAVILVMYVILSARWQLMAGRVLKSSPEMNAAVYFKATFLNTFTPANLGGDGYRLVVLKSETVSTGEMLRLLLRERILGLYGYVIVFVSAYGFIVATTAPTLRWEGNPYIYGLAVAMAFFMLPFLARPLGICLVMVLRSVIGKLRLPKLEGWVVTLADLLSPKGTLRLMLLTFFGILFWVLSIRIVAEGFGLQVPLLHLAAAATLVELIRMVPVTIQGIGLREGAFSYLLSFFGHNPEQCYVVALVAYLALSVSILLCGPIGQLLMRLEQTKIQVMRMQERHE